ncbi:5-methyltetrahydropteroyltriglutamate--homocysteine S-methyltransferase [Lacticaseibacillus pabuli]|uniref:5-methyltetrahydropteroyltriglutamate--homocysteine methyltransferase n=1 Tax=Lacticaseibacillus pabuli TaxID=3025672 RepID=A0ABY7WQ50_9LACO|nr:5-methyltetrahydropteroyltriglutamate--homocysteine S-methyltransferase [Lacticaseibacillus sp. KACC 23028]WDF82322.1 5-methyltetrahydropteroyltriglutamate--homocysteine S-methyltransferase [Lacticaseibacillus sp. KACC 23028]
MTTTVIGYPRIGAKRELKFATQKYFKNRISEDELQAKAAQLRSTHWNTLKNAGIDQIPSNDFSFFDNTLDAAFLLNIVPERYAALHLPALAEYFALARGYQGEDGDVKALPMKKWFNTNYHYIVPEFSPKTKIQLHGSKIFEEFQEAKDQGIITRPVIVGPYTLLRLGRFVDGAKPADFIADLAAAYKEIIEKLSAEGAEWFQIDEPALVYDQTEADLETFRALYDQILPAKGSLKILLQTYFGDLRDSLAVVDKFDFDGIGLDFVEGRENLEVLNKVKFPKDKTLFAGVINGKNIWKAHYAKVLSTIQAIQSNTDAPIVISTSCSLLHVPYTLDNEPKLPADEKQYLAFANEKLGELHDIDHILTAGLDDPAYQANIALFSKPRYEENKALNAKIAALTPADYTRKPARKERLAIQKKEFNLPILPTTTIGSFPQSPAVRKNRYQLRHGEITKAQYDKFNEEETKRWIKFQEDIGIDVLVHGEFERNDMVEYFGEHLNGYRFTENGWVQSYGTRAVKPPIIWGDVSRREPITVDASVYAQSQTKKIMKGMLTGPVTMLNWSFPREDVSRELSTQQLALALQEEVLDLEAHGIKIIQIDEAALREKLPLRKSDWFTKYLDWAVPAFRLVGAKVKPTTQIHTHMCYSEFGDIIPAIDDLDADVISFEASRADLTLLDALQKNHFETEVGPGVYDIHSPRVPSEQEIINVIHKILAKVPADNVWINPDCGLKTREEPEAKASLINLVAATKAVRAELAHEN